jgi:hypothetical protein
MNKDVRLPFASRWEPRNIDHDDALIPANQKQQLQQLRALPRQAATRKQRGYGLTPYPLLAPVLVYPWLARLLAARIDTMLSLLSGLRHIALLPGLLWISLLLC